MLVILWPWYAEASCNSNPTCSQHEVPVFPRIAVFVKWLSALVCWVHSLHYIYSLESISATSCWEVDIASTAATWHAEVSCNTHPQASQQTGGWANQPAVSCTICLSARPAVVSTRHVTRGWKLVRLSRPAVFHFTGRRRQWWVGTPHNGRVLSPFCHMLRPVTLKNRNEPITENTFKTKLKKHPHHNKRLTQTTQPTLQEFWTGEEREANSLNLTRKRTSKRQANSEDVS